MSSIIFFSLLLLSFCYLNNSNLIAFMSHEMLCCSFVGLYEE